SGRRFRGGRARRPCQPAGRDGHAGRERDFLPRARRGQVRRSENSTARPRARGDDFHAGAAKRSRFAAAAKIGSGRADFAGGFVATPRRVRVPGGYAVAQPYERRKTGGGTGGVAGILAGPRQTAARTKAK